VADDEGGVEAMRMTTQVADGDGSMSMLTTNHSTEDSNNGVDHGAAPTSDSVDAVTQASRCEGPGQGMAEKGSFV
jgi:hypothetical protein